MINSQSRRSTSYNAPTFRPRRVVTSIVVLTGGFAVAFNALVQHKPEAASVAVDFVHAAKDSVSGVFRDDRPGAVQNSEIQNVFTAYSRDNLAESIFNHSPSGLGDSTGTYLAMNGHDVYLIHVQDGKAQDGFEDRTASANLVYMAPVLERSTYVSEIVSYVEEQGLRQTGLYCIVPVRYGSIPETSLGMAGITLEDPEVGLSLHVSSHGDVRDVSAVPFAITPVSTGQVTVYGQDAKAVRLDAIQPSLPSVRFEKQVPEDQDTPRPAKPPVSHSDGSLQLASL